MPCQWKYGIKVKKNGIEEIEGNVIVADSSILVPKHHSIPASCCQVFIPTDAENATRRIEQ